MFKFKEVVGCLIPEKPTHFSDIADPSQDTHLLDLLHQFTKSDGITLLNSGYTQDGIMADFRYSVDHKSYVIEIREKK